MSSFISYSNERTLSKSLWVEIRHHDDVMTGFRHWDIKSYRRLKNCLKKNISLGRWRRGIFSKFRVGFSDNEQSQGAAFSFLGLFKDTKCHAAFHTCMLPGHFCVPHLLSVERWFQCKGECLFLQLLLTISIIRTHIYIITDNLRSV